MPVFHVLAIITRCSQTVEVLGRQELVLADLAQKPGARPETVIDVPEIGISRQMRWCRQFHLMAFEARESGLDDLFRSFQISQASES